MPLEHSKPELHPLDPETVKKFDRESLKHFAEAIDRICDWLHYQVRPLYGELSTMLSTHDKSAKQKDLYKQTPTFKGKLAGIHQLIKESLLYLPCDLRDPELQFKFEQFSKTNRINEIVPHLKGLLTQDTLHLPTIEKWLADQQKLIHNFVNEQIL